MLINKENLQDKFVSKLFHYVGENVISQCSSSDVIEKCVGIIRVYGRYGSARFYMKGSEGKGRIRSRRIFPSGPVGKVEEFSKNGKFIAVKFSAEELLLAMGATAEWQKALVDHACIQWGEFVTLDNYSSFIRNLIGIEIEMQLANHIFVMSDGRVRYLAYDLVAMLELALQNKWNSINGSKWGERKLFSASCFKY